MISIEIHLNVQGSEHSNPFRKNKNKNDFVSNLPVTLVFFFLNSDSNLVMQCCAMRNSRGFALTDCFIFPGNF